MTDTDKKLEEVKKFFRRMKHAQQIEEFAKNLELFLSSAREIIVVMQKEFCEKPNFEEWLDYQQREMQADDVFEFFNRIEEVRIGERTGNRVITSSRESVVYISEVDIQFPPRDKWRFSIAKNGKLTWTTPKGFEFEASDFPRKLMRVYIVDNPPKTFLRHDLKSMTGFPLDQYSVVFLCSLYLAFLSSLVREAKEEFGNRFV